MMKVKETENATYITVLFEHERIPHQVSITAYNGNLLCEIVPPTVAAKEFIKKLCSLLGMPSEGPRTRMSYSDCGEEPGSLVVSWKSEKTAKEWTEGLMKLLEMEGHTK